ncbi:hypothetical protein D4764_01G0021670 [Takifugu flavidus]|uniref:CCHC-type domain-containing protein n=1 Tax=Takifugu flavidus TaxID=433684 RepID=A0A5C6PRC0_9TELE|nr:hypothetical protein D4764_01G0021670 [Takifugu flavidus]
MASSGTPSLSIRHGVRVQPDPSVPVEEVLLAVGDQVGHTNLSYASRMNRGVVAELVGRGVTVNGAHLQVSPLAAPSTRVTASGVPPFITNEALEQELQDRGSGDRGSEDRGSGDRGSEDRGTVGLRTVGPGTVGPGTVALRTVALGTVGLRTVGLGTVGLGTVGLRTVALGTVGLGTVALRTVGLGTVALGTVALRTVALGTVGLGTVALGTVGLGCRSDKLKHVLSLRRQCFMFLTCPSQTLDVSFRVRHGEGHYMVYASSGSMRCFECGDVGHKRVACPHRPANEGARTGAMSSRVAPPSGGGDEGGGDAGGGPSGQVEEQGGGECVAAVRAGREGAVEEVQMGGKEEVQMGGKEEVQMGVNVQPGAAEEEEQPGAAEEEEQPGAGGVSGDQGQAAGEQLPDQPAEMLSVDEGGEEVMESDSDSWGSVADSQSLTGDLGV